MKRILMTVLIVGAFTTGKAQDWPDWRGRNREGIWKENGITENFKQDPLPVIWRVTIGPGYSGPTVCDGKVYLTDRPEKPEGQERILCFDAGTGKSVWSHAYDCKYVNVGYPAGPRASVVVDGDRAYSLGTMGNLYCFNSKTGAVLWSRDLNSDFKIKMPIWGIAATPLIAGNKIIIQIGGSENACVVALDKKTGSEIWRSLNDGASYSAPVIINRGSSSVLIVWTAENLAGIDPETGKVYWTVPFLVKMAMAIATPVVYEDYVFVSSFYSGSLLVKLSENGLKATKVWMRAGENERKTDALHCVINTSLLKDGCIYGVDSYGELRCLDLLTGNRIWEDLTAVVRNRWANIHFIQHEMQTWMFNEQGELLITELSPSGLKVISSAKLIEPTTQQLNRNGVGVTWSHPAFAGRKVFARNDRELICADLSK